MGRPLPSGCRFLPGSPSRETVRSRPGSHPVGSSVSARTDHPRNDGTRAVRLAGVGCQCAQPQRRRRKDHGHTGPRVRGRASGGRHPAGRPRSADERHHNGVPGTGPAANGQSNGQSKRRWSVADVLDDPTRKVIDKVIRVSAWGESLRILPGSERTENHNHPDPGSKSLFRLAGALAKVDPAPELVLVDCPPSLGQLTRSALIAADRAVLVTEPSLFAVTGVQRALEAVQTETTGAPVDFATAGRGDQSVPASGHRTRIPAGRAAGPVRAAGAVAGTARPVGRPTGAGGVCPHPSMADGRCP